MKPSDIYREIKGRITRWAHTQPSLTLAIARHGDDIHLEFHHPKRLSETQRHAIDEFISQRLREKFKFEPHAISQAQYPSPTLGALILWQVAHSSYS